MGSQSNAWRANAWLGAVACLATGMAAGMWLTRGEATFSLPPIEAHATASQSHDNFVIATGYVDEGVEAVFFLDFLTGDLKAAVLNRRGQGFNAYYKYNIAADFNLGTVKNAKYLMVTGLARDMNVAGAAGRLGRGVVYVVEATSGQVAAYGLPWNPSMHASGKQQTGTFVPLARAALRTEFVRDQ